jgi:hypothetical protein
MAIFEVYGLQLDTSKVPQSAIDVSLVRVARHILGNEVAAKAKAAKDAGMVEGAELDAKIAAWRQEGLDKLYNGTLGVRTVGEPVAPLEAAIERFAKGELTAWLAAKGIKWQSPKGPDGKAVKGEAKFVALADGTFTMEALLDRYMAKPANADKATAAAKKELAANAKRSAALAQEDLV